MKRFRIRYSAGPIPAAWDTTCSSPIAALDQFHKHMQVELAKRPEEYNLEALAEVDNTDPTGGCRGSQVESPFDLPTSGNPDVGRTQTNPEDLNNTFKFYEKATGGKLSE